MGVILTKLLTDSMRLRAAISGYLCTRSVEGICAAGSFMSSPQSIQYALHAASVQIYVTFRTNVGRRNHE